MYGLVNRAIMDLVVSTAGEEAWHAISEKAGLQSTEFLDSAEYADDITYSLVGAASQVLQLPAEDILHAFGRHWILYTGREGWDSLFDLGGDSMQEFLEGLDDMHARVQIAMPDARMPQFTVVDKTDHLYLEYHSHRDGLAHMVLGLLDGLAEKFEENWSIEHVGKRAEFGHDRFLLKQVNADTTFSDNANAA